jgi:adenylate kinase
LPSKYADLCIVTHCDLKTLQQRLGRRCYNKKKIRENLDAEIFDVCLVEAIEQGHKTITFDTTKTTISDIKNLSNKIKKQLK